MDDVDTAVEISEKDRMLREKEAEVLNLIETIKANWYLQHDKQQQQQRQNRLHRIG